MKYPNALRESAMEELEPEYKKSLLTIAARISRISPIWRLASAVFLITCIVSYISLVSPPKEFPVRTTITISDGMALSDIANRLAGQGVIRSTIVFKGLVVLMGGEKKIFAGNYFFDTRKNVYHVARAFAVGEFGLEPVKVTIPEGATAAEIAKKLSLALGEEFDEEKFIGAAKEKEGYLFPDTYFFLPNEKEEEIIARMERTFDKRIQEVADTISVFGRPLEEVVIMASLLEKEANLPETRRTIAGILWKRLDEGMPLQVDAVFLYINGKNTFQLTLDDLQIDSPYNTYRYAGLPEGPIANPGLDAILAAITPIETEYYYYLSDKEGTMHFSETFEDHKKNKQLYLN